MTTITIRKMFEAGMHFGHSTRFWNPKIKPFIYGAYNGVHIIDLDKSYPLFIKAINFLRGVSADGGKILFVGCKRSAARILAESAVRCGTYYVTRRWLGGTLTNFSTIRRSVNNYLHLEESFAKGDFSSFSKKETVKLRHELEKMRRNFEGIKEMVRPPDAMFIVDVVREKIAVLEAQALNIPVVAILDTNCDIDSIDYIIPGNDDALSSISLYASAVADAIIEGAAKAENRITRNEQNEAAAPPAWQKSGADGTQIAAAGSDQEVVVSKTPGVSAGINAET